MNYNTIILGEYNVFSELSTAIDMVLYSLGHTKIRLYINKNGKEQPVIDNTGVHFNIYVGVSNIIGDVDRSVYNIYYNTEQWDTIDKDTWKKLKRKFNLTLDMFRHKHYFDKTTRYCPIGYSPAFEFPKYHENMNDAIFHIGMMRNGDKLPVWEQYRNIINCDHVWGEDRNRRMMRSKIHLITRLRQGYELPQIRLMLSMSNKILTLVNEHKDYGVYEQYKHFMLFDNLKTDSEYWYKNDQERIEFVNNCYNDIKENHSFDMYFKRALRGTPIFIEDEESEYIGTWQETVKRGTSLNQDDIKLSVLVCTLPSRTKCLDYIIKELDRQAQGKPVEILYLGDNGIMDIGKKRNHLVRLAQGKYITQVDDDDRISDDYISQILNAIGDETTDSVVFDVQIKIDKQEPKLVRYGKDFPNETTDYGYIRMSNHLMCVKRSLALEYPFPETGRGEDTKWAEKICPNIKSETRIDKVLYYYDAVTATSESIKRYTRLPHLYPVGK